MSVSKTSKLLQYINYRELAFRQQLAWLMLKLW